MNVTIIHSLYTCSAHSVDAPVPHSFVVVSDYYMTLKMQDGQVVPGTYQAFEGVGAQWTNLFRRASTPPTMRSVRVDSVEALACEAWRARRLVGRTEGSRLDFPAPKISPRAVSSWANSLLMAESDDESLQIVEKRCRIRCSRYTYIQLLSLHEMQISGDVESQG